MLIAQTVLNHLQIASPCSADWASMSGDERCRHCAQCDKRVYDISALRADEALALIQEAEGHLCVRLWRRADGTVLTADCPLGRRVRARRRIFAMAGAAPLLTLALNCRVPRAETTPLASLITVNPSVVISPAGDQASAIASLPRRKKPVMVEVGFVAAPGIDMTRVATGQTLDSETLSHLPIR